MNGKVERLRRELAEAEREAGITPSAQSEDDVVVTWDEAKKKILAVTRQDSDGVISSVIAMAPLHCPDCGERDPAEIHTCSPQQPAPSAEPVQAADGYGSTEFGFTFAGAYPAEAEKRLMSMLVTAFGTEHPAVDDMVSVIFSKHAAPQPDSGRVEEMEAEIDKLGDDVVQLRAGRDSLLVDRNSLARRVAELEAECERLTKCLAKANEQAEHFERQWYLRGDEVERLRKALELAGRFAMSGGATLAEKQQIKAALAAKGE